MPFPHTYAAMLTQSNLIIRPDADVETADWNTAPLFSKVNEITANDTTQIFSLGQFMYPATVPFDFTVGLSNPASTPSASAIHRITVRARREDVVGSGHLCDLKIELLETTTVIATRNFPAISNTYINRVVTLTSLEAASISNYNNLRIRVTATLSLTVEFEEVRCAVSWIEMRFI